MQEKTSKKFKFWNRRPWKIAAIVTAITGIFASGSLAFTLGDVNKWTTSVWKDLNSEQGLLTQFRKASAEFNAEMKNFAGMSEAVVAAVTGEEGQLIPDKTDKEVWQKATANALGAATVQGVAAAAGGKQAANIVLSKSGQDLDASARKAGNVTAQETIARVKDVNDVNTRVQKAPSSQEVLKGISEQNVHQAQIHNALVQLLVSMSKDTKDAKQAGAATTLTLSEMLILQQGERQGKIIQENHQANSSEINQYRNTVNTGL